MRRQRDELTLQLVGALERVARLALLREEAGAVEREAGERAEGLQQLALLVAEERRERARTHDQPPEREGPHRELVTGVAVDCAVRADPACRRSSSSATPARADHAAPSARARLSATSSSLVAVISSPIASCMRACSGRRQSDPQERRRREAEQERDGAE